MRHEIYAANGKTLLRVEELPDPAYEPIRQQLAADLAAQPLGVQLAFRDASQAIMDLLVQNQIPKAREALATWPLPPQLETLRTLLLSRFPA